MTTWQERFEQSHDPQCSECWVDYDLDNGKIEGIDFAKLAGFISEERNAVARDVLERIAKAFANVETNDQLMFIAKFAVELQKLGEGYSI